ncbi:MAG: hypothetical protein ABJN26_24805 [Stappiaceae bacterium]
MSKLTALISVLVLLGLTACEKKDDRFPAYYRYKLEVKVDGVPVTLDRVIKCTGTLKKDAGNPSTWGGKNYSNPPMIGAKVPGSSAAVFAPTPYACGWAAEFGGKQWQEPPVKPGDILPIVWVKDADTFSEIEYYVSRSSLARDQGHVEFLKLSPLERVSEVEFNHSEKQAAGRGLNIGPFLRPTEKLRKELADEPTSWNSIRCSAAWRVDRQEWTRVPGLTAWAEGRERNGLAHRIPDEFRARFLDIAPFRRGTSAANKFNPIKQPTRRNKEEFGSFATFDAIYPVLFTAQGPNVDLKRPGVGGCLNILLFESRNLNQQPGYSAKFTPERSLAPYKLTDDKLSIALFDSEAFYVPDLESFLIFVHLPSPSYDLDDLIFTGPR